MAEYAEKKTKNRKIIYNVLFMPDDDTMAVRKMSVRMEVLIAFFAAIAFLIVTALT